MASINNLHGSDVIYLILLILHIIDQFFLCRIAKKISNSILHRRRPKRGWWDGVTREYMY